MNEQTANIGADTPHLVDLRRDLAECAASPADAPAETPIDLSAAITHGRMALMAHFCAHRA